MIAADHTLLLSDANEIVGERREFICSAHCCVADCSCRRTAPTPRPGQHDRSRLIVPTGPGAATDVMARLLGEGVGRTLGQPVVVENMPGASGILAHQAVARAAPDGHTLLFTNTSGMAINLVSFKQLALRSDA